ncbi:MAG: 30S ribosomal protein S4 [Candidatus Jorgensenbacteria bacterium]|nr:30S ribosomal protein S4 [Candidatus Jorgensenbacteria bacterium]
MTHPVKEKRERALNTKLFLKAERSYSPKSAIVRRPKRPGQHGDKRQSITEYGRQLQEKQKIQISFGLNNRQTRTLFHKPKEKIIETLFQRLDSVTFMLGFAKSQRIARQMVSHGHILVNGRKVTIPSCHVTIGNKISIRPESRASKLFEGIGERLQKYTPPTWLRLSPEELTGECIAKSSGGDTEFPFDMALVSEFYSR